MGLSGAPGLEGAVGRSEVGGLLGVDEAEGLLGALGRAGRGTVDLGANNCMTMIYMSDAYV